MSNIEHLIENAIVKLEEGKTYQDWLDMWPQHEMLKLVKSPPEEIWQMAQYCVYTYGQNIKWDTEAEIEKAYGYPIPKGE